MRLCAGDRDGSERAAKTDRTGGRFKARQRPHELGLAVAGNPGHADDLVPAARSRRPGICAR